MAVLLGDLDCFGEEGQVTGREPLRAGIPYIAHNAVGLQPSLAILTSSRYRASR
jgi:hypothetical protein